MKMSEKICNNCGNKVDGTANFCPMCRSQSFKYVEIGKPKNSIVHSLFYYYKDKYYILSKSKVTAFIVFILIATAAFEEMRMIIFAVIISFLVYVIGFAIHQMRENRKLPEVVLKNNDLGLTTDLKHYFLYWQDKYTGEYRISKTKSISLLIFFTIIAINIQNAGVYAIAFVSLFFTIPVFIIGYVIHRITTSKPVQNVIEKTQPIINNKEEVKVEESVHEFDEYRVKLNELKLIYEIKGRNARDLIEKRFTPPQLTYDKFIESVDKSDKMFNIHVEVISNILDLASEDSKRIDDELRDRFGILEALVKKMDELIDELVVSLNDDEKEGNPSDLLHDLDDLIDSVKDY